VLGDRAIALYLAGAWSIADHAGPSAFLLDFDDDPIGTADLAWFASLIGMAPNRGRQAVLIQTPGGRHAIASWADRLVPALVQLLDEQCAG
jgi:hypothetical protein